MIYQGFLLLMALNGIDGALTSSMISNDTNQVTTPIGGNRGSWFNDCSVGRDEITQINVKAGWFIDNIQVRYGDEMAGSHGKNKGTLNECILNADEKIVAVRGRYGSVIDQIEFVTNHEQVCV